MAPYRRSALFIADALGLDFLNSGATCRPDRIEWLQDGKMLLAWLEQARIDPPDLLEQLRALARPAELDAIARQARDLRESFRAFVLAHLGHALDGSVLAELSDLNRLLREQHTYQQIVALRRGLELRTCWRWSSPRALLVPIAGALAEVVCDADFRHIRVCEGQHCGLLFFDRTRGLARRWCSMADCGNRAKQAALRRRRVRDRRARNRGG
jgi:predicted RNA-binding Zn ribbon-like protein